MKVNLQKETTSFSTLLDMMFAIHQFLEKCQEQYQELHIVFVDLVKVFDTVNRPLMWALLKKIGIPPKLTNIIRSFHDCMEARVLVSGELTESFEVSNALCQGCILAPTLFILFFTFVLRHAHNFMSGFGIEIKHRLDGRLFNLQRLKTKSARTTKLADFLYVDDAALVTMTLESLQEGVMILNNSCNIWGLTISKLKTEVMHVLCDHPPAIKFDDFQLKHAHTFTFL